MDRNEFQKIMNKMECINIECEFYNNELSNNCEVESHIELLDCSDVTLRRK